MSLVSRTEIWHQLWFNTAGNSCPDIQVYRFWSWGELSKLYLSYRQPSWRYCRAAWRGSRGDAGLFLRPVKGMFVWKLWQAHGWGITPREAIGCIKGRAIQWGLRRASLGNAVWETGQLPRDLVRKRSPLVVWTIVERLFRATQSISHRPQRWEDTRLLPSCMETGRGGTALPSGQLRQGTQGPKGSWKALDVQGFEARGHWTERGKAQGCDCVLAVASFTLTHVENSSSRGSMVAWREGKKNHNCNCWKDCLMGQITGEFPTTLSTTCTWSVQNCKSYQTPLQLAIPATVVGDILMTKYQSCSHAAFFLFSLFCHI